MEWISRVFEALLSLFPRVIRVRATCRAVKWRYGKEVVQLDPGVYVYWPLVSEVDTVVTARQTQNIKPQVLLTRDGKQVMLAAAVVFWVRDAVRAIGERNWDISECMMDVTQSALAEFVSRYTLEQLMEGLHRDGAPVLKDLTGKVRKKLRTYGIHVQRVGLTDIAPCRVYRMVTCANSGTGTWDSV